MSRILNKEIRDIIFFYIRNMDYSKVLPEKILKANSLMKNLEEEPIDFDRLFLYGCPIDYYFGANKECNKENPIPKKCKKCTLCWIKNLTIEDDNYINKDDLLKEYLKIKLEPNQIEKLLTLLNYNNKDFDSFISEIEKILKDSYENKNLINDE